MFLKACQAFFEKSEKGLFCAWPLRRLGLKSGIDSIGNHIAVGGAVPLFSSPKTSQATVIFIVVSSFFPLSVVRYYTGFPPNCKQTFPKYVQKMRKSRHFDKILLFRPVPEIPGTLPKVRQSIVFPQIGPQIAGNLLGTGGIQVAAVHKIRLPVQADFLDMVK